MTKTVISDTSCLIALTRIDRMDILQQLFGVIYTTEIVKVEFIDPLPIWIIVENVTNIE